MSSAARSTSFPASPKALSPTRGDGFSVGASEVGDGVDVLTNAMNKLYSLAAVIEMRKGRDMINVLAGKLHSSANTNDEQLKDTVQRLIQLQGDMKERCGGLGGRILKALSSEGKPEFVQKVGKFFGADAQKHMEQEAARIQSNLETLINSPVSGDSADSLLKTANDVKANSDMMVEGLEESFRAANCILAVYALAQDVASYQETMTLLRSNAAFVEAKREQLDYIDSQLKLVVPIFNAQPVLDALDPSVPGKEVNQLAVLKAISQVRSILTPVTNSLYLLRAEITVQQGALNEASTKHKAGMLRSVLNFAGNGVSALIMPGSLWSSLLPVAANVLSFTINGVAVKLTHDELYKLDGLAVVQAQLMARVQEYSDTLILLDQAINDVPAAAAAPLLN